MGYSPHSAEALALGAGAVISVVVEELTPESSIVRAEQMFKIIRTVGLDPIARDQLIH